MPVILVDGRNGSQLDLLESIRPRAGTYQK
jgi:hypothetical protein